MILNIHGYNSTGDNSKYRFLQKLKAEGRLDGYGEIYSPSLDYATQNEINIMNRLENFFKLHSRINEPDFVIGSSLGGFFAYCLCAIYECKTLLINPSLLPFITLRKNYGKYAGGYAKLFGKYAFEAEARCLEVVIGDSDEMIDHNETTRYLTTNQFKVIKGGAHHLEMDTELQGLIMNFLGVDGD